MPSLKSMLEKLFAKQLQPQPQVVVRRSESGIVLGTNRQPVTLQDSVRDRHAYDVGTRGVRKSTLLFNAALHDIKHRVITATIALSLTVGMPVSWDAHNARGIETGEASMLVASNPPRAQRRAQRRKARPKRRTYNLGSLRRKRGSRFGRVAKAALKPFKAIGRMFGTRRVIKSGKRRGRTNRA